MSVKSFCVLALIALTIVLTAPATITAAEHADASAINSTSQSVDDILYLRRFTYNNLTTTAPPSGQTAANISVSTGSSITRRWVNETAVPNGYNWTIPGGNYIFRFWINSTKDTGVHADVSFTFGYIREGQEFTIVTGSTTITNVGTSIRSVDITASGGEQKIRSGSKLFIKVTISARGASKELVYFYYDGHLQPTRIETPPISQVVVSEFPFGTVLLPPCLILAYFILRRRAIRFRA